MGRRDTGMGQRGSDGSRSAFAAPDRARRLRFTCVRSGCSPPPPRDRLASLSSRSSAQAAFGFKTLSLSFTNEDTSAATQAGSHPYAWTTALTLNTTGSGAEELPDGALKDLRIQLPPGLVGTPGLLPHCSHADFLTQTCPAASEVGASASAPPPPKPKASNSRSTTSPRCPATPPNSPSPPRACRSSSSCRSPPSRPTT